MTNKKNLIFLIIFILLSYNIFSQVIIEETEEENTVQNQQYKFSLYLNAGITYISNSGDLIDHINDYSDRPSSSLTFIASSELYYKFNNNLKISAYIQYSYPYENTYYFTLSPSVSTTDNFCSLLFGILLSYNIINEENMTLYPSAGILIGKSKYEFSGAFVTKNNYVITDNEDESCMDVFGFIIKANLTIDSFLFSVGYISTSGDLIEDSFYGYTREFNNSYIIASIGYNLLVF